MLSAVPLRTFAEISGDSYRLFNAVLFVLQMMEYGIFEDECPEDRVN
jgi:hypothetical protein